MPSFLRDPDSTLRIFLPSMIVWVLVLVATGIISSLSDAATVAVLGGMEFALSFDNAVVNSKMLRRMSPRWQQLFMTFGVLIAVFGMRLLLPVIIVTVTAHLSVGDVIGMALRHPQQYQHHLDSAHPAIAAFGGVFLMLIFLDFMFGEREIMWLKPLENSLLRIGKLDQLSVIITGVVLAVVGIAYGDGHQGQILLAGLLGLVSYLVVNALSKLVPEEAASVAKMGLIGFLYLEVVDASFSFDGVISAFAITQKVLLIAGGLGLGAMAVRSLTVYFVRKNTLSKYSYVESGAYWAIGFLAVCLMLSEKYHISEGVTGGVAVILIVVAFVHSKLHGAVETITHEEGAASGAVPEVEYRSSFAG